MSDKVIRTEPEMQISKLKDGTIVEVIPRSEFWTSIVIVIILLAAVPYLSYCIFTFYDKAKPLIDAVDAGGTFLDPEKKKLDDMWISAIVIIVLLTIAVIIFIAFYFKNYNKSAFAKDKISIKDAFQNISREIAQHAADKYSDEQVENHIEDMETLGGRIMAAKQGDVWYNDPKEFRRNYREDTPTKKGEGYRTFTKRPPMPPQEPGETAAPATVQGAINNPGPTAQEGPQPVKLKQDAPYVPW